MNKLVIYLLFGIIALFSCKRNSSFFSSEKDKLEIVEPDFDFLSSKAKFRFVHDNKKVSATANFRIRKDSIIWISITPGFGLEVARVLIKPNRIFVLDKLNRRYYEYTFEELSNQYVFNFNFKLVQSVILGNLSEPYLNQEIEKIDTHFSYEAKKGHYTFQNYIGTQSLKLEKVEIFDDSSKNMISINYGDFVIVDQEVFPTVISAIIDYGSVNKPNTEIYISYNKLVIEQTSPTFPFRVPNRYGKK